MPNGQCPDCDADVHVDAEADKGEIVDREERGVGLEVVGLDPLELAVVCDDLDDDEDDDEDDEDDY